MLSLFDIVASMVVVLLLFGTMAASLFLNTPISSMRRSLKTGFSTSAIVDVLDLGVDYPDLSLSEDAGGALRLNGVTFTVHNQDQSEPLHIVGVEVLMGETVHVSDGLAGETTGKGMTLQLYARAGENHKSPLEQSGQEWILLQEEENIHVPFGTNRFVPILMSASEQKGYDIPPMSAATLFVFVKENPSCILASKIQETPGLTSDANLAFINERLDRRIALQTGAGVRDIRSRPNDPWTNMPNSVFLGSLMYQFDNAPEATTFKQPEMVDGTVQHTISTMSVWESTDKLVYSYGIVFDVHTVAGCKISSLDIHTGITGGYILVETYVKIGSYRTDIKTDLDDWKMVSKAAVLGQGETESTSIPIQQFYPINIPPDTIASFYVTTSQKEMISIATSEQIGTVIEGAEVSVISDSDDATYPRAVTSEEGRIETLSVMVGQAVTKYPTASLSESLGDNVMFSGKVHYHAEIPNEAPSVAPTFSPTPPVASEQISQLKLTIDGVSSRSLLRRFLEADGDHENVMENGDIRGHFEKISQEFISRSITQKMPYLLPSIDVSRFVVSPEITEEDLFPTERQRWRRTSFLNVSSKSQNSLRSVQDESTEKDSLNVYATILGDYSPPPVLDFSSLTEDLFNDFGDDFLSDLKEPQMSEPDAPGPEMFAEARAIRAKTVSFPIPENLYDDAPPDAREGILSMTDSSDTSDPTDFLMYVYIASGALAGSLFGLCTVCLCCRRMNEKNKDKTNKQEEKDQFDSGDSRPSWRNTTPTTIMNQNDDVCWNESARSPRRVSFNSNAPKRASFASASRSPSVVSSASSAAARVVQTPPHRAEYTSLRASAVSSSRYEGEYTRENPSVHPPQSQRSHRDDAYNKRNFMEKSQRFWSVSGRHILSKSQRRIWDAATGEPVMMPAEPEYHHNYRDRSDPKTDVDVAYPGKEHLSDRGPPPPPYRNESKQLGSELSMSLEDVIYESGGFKK